MTTQPFSKFNPSPELCAQRRRIVRKRTMAGHTAAQIALELGVSERSVSRMRADIGITRPPRRLLSAAERAVIEDMLEDGCSYAEIGRSIGRTANTIMGNYPHRSTFELLGRHHLKLAKKLGLELIS